MKFRITLCVMLFAAFGAPGVSAQNLSVSGILDSTVSLRAGAGDSPAFSFGVEEYANLRVQARIREAAVFYGAVNFIAAAGDPAAMAKLAADPRFNPGDGFARTPFIAGTNYIAGLELERLYFRLNGEYLSFDAGLFRLPFGYSQVWGSSDFLNPKNPLVPDARPRAVLGGGLSWYPSDSLKLLVFGAAPRNPFSQPGEGGLAGLSMDHHWDRVSLQLLYSFESPADGSSRGIHRAGMSAKADLEVSMTLDTLYTYNQEENTALDGLSLSLGADYSFFDGNLIVLAEYLYNGAASSTAFKSGGSFSNENYLYTGLTWSFSDYTNMGAALLSCFDDISFTPVLTFNHDLFQGAVLTLSAQIPLDRDLFSRDGNRGELGPLPPDRLQALLPLTGQRMGSFFNLSAKLRLRF